MNEEQVKALFSSLARRWLATALVGEPEAQAILDIFDSLTAGRTPNWANDAAPIAAWLKRLADKARTGAA